MATHLRGEFAERIQLAHRDRDHFVRFIITSDAHCPRTSLPHLTNRRGGHCPSRNGLPGLPSPSSRRLKTSTDIRPAIFSSIWMRNGARCNANSATATSTGNDDDGGTDVSTFQTSKRLTGSDHVTMTDDEPSCTNSSGPAHYQYTSLETTDVRRSKNVSSFVVAGHRPRRLSPAAPATQRTDGTPLSNQAKMVS